MKVGYFKILIAFLIFLFSYGKEVNLFPFYDKDREKWGYKNEEGEIIIQPQFDHARFFGRFGTDRNWWQMGLY